MSRTDKGFRDACEMGVTLMYLCTKPKFTLLFISLGVYSLVIRLCAYCKSKYFGSI